MNMVKSLFPQAMQARDVKGLVITILVYAIVAFVAGLIFGLLDNIPLLGFVFGLVGWVIGVYCAVGIIVSLLVFLNVVK